MKIMVTGPQLGSRGSFLNPNQLTLCCTQTISFGALKLLLEQEEGHPSCKKICCKIQQSTGRGESMINALLTRRNDKRGESV